MSLKALLKLVTVATAAAVGGAVVTTVAIDCGWTGLYFSAPSQTSGIEPGLTPDHGQTHIARATPGAPDAGGRQLYHCGMHPWIIMDHPGNCPICHMALLPIANSSPSSMTQAQQRILYYWDPTAGSSSISDKPGKSALGIDLRPVYENEVTGGPAVTIDPAVVQNMGVQTAPVMKGPLIKTVRAAGIVDLPEPAMHDIALKVNGWIDKLYADTTGMRIHKDQPLFDLYSPDLISAQEELISVEQTLRELDATSSPEVRRQARQMVAGARRKLELWDVPDSQIDAIAKFDHAQKTITFRSPVEGNLQQKMIVEGAAVQAGTNLLRIADQSILWLNAKVYEQNLPMVEVGQEVEAVIDGLPGKSFKAKIIFISPHVDQMIRTTDVRIELSNADFAIKPGMYATVLIRTQSAASTLWVAREAVIDTGTRQIVFVVEPGGRFVPRLVTMGLSGDDDHVEILKGLAPGETVVTSGQFLLDVESRINGQTNEAIRNRPAGEADRTTGR